jgi:hypothetical protein
LIRDPTEDGPVNGWPGVRRLQSDAEFPQGRFCNLCGAAIVFGKQEDRVCKLPACCVIGQPAIGYDARQCWPSNVERLE